MLNIKVLGPGCANCSKVEAHTKQALEMLQPEGGYKLTKVTGAVEARYRRGEGIRLNPALHDNR